MLVGAAAATPRAMSTPPATVRAVRGCGAADSLERIASTGWTRPARRAGAQAESMVTAVPTTIGTTTASADRPSPPWGSSMPLAPMTALITATSTAPATTPTAEPNTPTTKASTATERVIWRRLEPSARSSANSLARWATIIEKVFAMRKVPTRRPTRPKAMRK